jgi:hypothetical protein
VKTKYLLIAVLSLSLFMFHTISANDKPRVFTNDDLSRHNVRDSRDSTDRQSLKTSPANNKPVRHKTSNDKEKEKWCKKGRHYQNRVDEAKTYLNEAERKYAEAQEKAAARPPKKKRILQKVEVSKSGIRKARLKVEKAEKRLLDIEQEAHRKNIPPGWLRCQFSY